MGFFFAAFAYDKSLFDFLFTEGERERESAGDWSRISLYLLAERNWLFLAKLAEESLKKVDAITGFKMRDILCWTVSVKNQYIY